MPTFEFICEECNKPFALIISFSDYEKNKFRDLTASTTGASNSLSATLTIEIQHQQAGQYKKITR